MKRQVFLFLILFLVIKGYGQNWTNINFDDSVGLNRISIDTLILSNIWQIGQPQKSVFNTAYSLPNSIITDTVSSYPSNNNSVFYLGTGGDWFMDSHTQSLNFLYRMDSDSLNDYGRIEISLDTGQTWNNILKTENGGVFWRVENSLGVIVIQPALGDTIVFTGSTNGWYRFKSEIHLLEQQHYDTIIYRFSFTTDSNVENKDGWIIDDIGYNMLWEGINDYNYFGSVYPNPANNVISVRTQRLMKSVEIINFYGISLKTLTKQCYNLSVDVADLNSGIYFCSILFEDGSRNIEKFIKYH